MELIKKEYRPELNGLRAIAVLLVLLFHLDLPWMKGGFLGVDIFLVISGYFISKNIISDLQQERFSFKKFYTKRLRRLFPALIVTLLLVMAAGYFIFPPPAYERLGLSSIFSSVSLSNFFFWNEAGYFDGEARTKPLLHMWSLSLEEQFYLFWPLLLVILHRLARKLLMLLIPLLVIVSLVLAEVYFNSDPSAVFFLIPFRMFEFLLGAWCIGLEQRKLFQSKYLKELLFLAGMVLMIFSAMHFDSFTRMPGLRSLIPCAGAMFVIIGGKAPWMSWSLKNKPVELIGKASYSIYLVHWPLIVYYKYWELTELDLSLQIKLGIISILLGIALWQLVENTFRYPKKVWAKIDPVWIAVPSLILILVAGSYYVNKSKGITSRFTGELYMTQEEILANRKLYWQSSNSKKTVLKGVPGKGHIIVFGNSHAIDLIYALRQNGFEGEITALQTDGKCYNFGTAEKEIDQEVCATKKEANLKNENWQLVDAVYLHDDWPVLDISGLRSVLKEVRELTTAPMYVFGPKMTYKAMIPDMVSQSKTVNPDIINYDACQFSFYELKTSINDSLREEFATNPYYQQHDIHFIDILTIQGGPNYDQFEVVSKDGLKFLYFDAGHFTKQGSLELGQKLKEVHPNLFEINPKIQPI